MTHAEMRRIRKEAILSATKELILRQGTGANLMTAIAEKSGISRQRLYQYYPNLEELVSALLRDTEERVFTREAALLARFADVRPVTDALSSGLEAVLEFLCRDDPVVRDDLLLLCLLDVQQTKNAGLPRSSNPDPVRKAPEELMEKLVRAGQREGLFRTDLPAETLVYLANQNMMGYACRLQMIRSDPAASVFAGPAMQRGLVRELIAFFQGAGKN